MLTQKQTTLWPFDRSVLKNCITLRNKPSTNEDILFSFCTIHQKMQVKTSRQSSQRDAATETLAELLLWWLKADYICQFTNDLVKKLLNPVNEHKFLSQDNTKIQSKKKKVTTKILQKQKCSCKKQTRDFG